MGLFGGTQVKTNIMWRNLAISVECHSVDSRHSSGDSKVLRELQIAMRSRLFLKRNENENYYLL